MIYDGVLLDSFVIFFIYFMFAFIAYPLQYETISFQVKNSRKSQYGRLWKCWNASIRQNVFHVRSELCICAYTIKSSHRCWDFILKYDSILFHNMFCILYFIFRILHTYLIYLLIRLYKSLCVTDVYLCGVNISLSDLTTPTFENRKVSDN